MFSFFLNVMSQKELKSSKSKQEVSKFYLLIFGSCQKTFDIVSSEDS